MEPGQGIRQSAESALRYRLSRRGLLRAAAIGGAAVTISGGAASLATAFLRSRFPGRSNGIVAEPNGILAVRSQDAAAWEPIPYGDAPLPGVEWVKLQGDPASVFAQVGNPDRYRGKAYRTSQLGTLMPTNTLGGPLLEVTAAWPGSYAVAVKFRHKSSGKIVEDIHQVDVRPPFPLFTTRCIALGYDTDGDNLQAASDGLDYVASLGANAVSLQTQINMASRSDTKLSLRRGSPSKEYFRAVIEMAHAKKLAVWFKMHLVVEDWDFYTGDIKPPDWNKWFASYTALILTYAELANAAGTEIMAIGNELGSSHSQRQLWAALIASVRKVFKGAVTYADDRLNYPPLEVFPAIDLLDYYGLNYWTPGSGLGNEANPKATPAEMREHMTSSSLPQRLAGFGKPFLVTEGAGMNPFDGLNSKPAMTVNDGVVDQQEAVDYMEACFRFWRQDLKSSSAIFWTTDLTPRPLPYRKNDPRGRPIEDAIRLWFGSSSAAFALAD
jgi:hypothetical protein